MPFEDEFSHALRVTAEASPPPAVELLAVGAQQRGRRKKLRRALVASTATMALVAGGGVLVAQLRPTASAQAADPPTATSNGTSAAAASPTAATSPVAATSAPPVTTEQMLTLLKQQLPPGTRLSDGTGQGVTPDPNVKADGPMASYTVTDSQGQGRVMINLQRVPTPVDLNFKTLVCADPALPTIACTRTQLPGGAYLRITKDSFRLGESDLLDWRAELQRPDGILVTASSSNFLTNHTDATRDQPPLSTDQLAALAQAPVWLDAARGVTPDLGYIDATAHTWLPLPLDDILHTAAPLLPAGLTELEPGGEPSFAHFLVDDGDGRSLVRVTVEDWSVYQKGKFNGGDISNQFTDSPTLPDGSRINADTQDPYGPYPDVVCNEVSVLRPDKLLVRVDAFNGTDYKGSATRDKPALTLDQLKAIALSPTWHGAAK